MQELIGLFEQKMQEQRQNLTRMREFDKLRKTVRTTGAAEAVSPTLLLLKPREEILKESELSCVTTVQKKIIVWEDNKVLVKLIECKKCEPCEVVLKIRET
ncbi:uncharacterized protein MONOS_15504 [Monocercomonoides exilis]|uniref:uncharacterized protein n=1 Tax=Monocercomonoides exilis TaxID=2049356 RepID=UPI00355A4780|nr:hypothetical protein MONOS_15504 [Monocercomonoides exilis]|eukprot:MONOS_15504.1-p1 / transcript=MONOS_15504.1 / gene=MONOS_15504 / organism=Monocercomonoides_exilis_PA203 / gene_product=unspecified product / transcript_product=unspecified product / location=Mono_scaffold01253:8269-8571(-) / protein_length=101 / sequence_SO=supercontig / SO=protein_coding / is_pseudo=false